MANFYYWTTDYTDPLEFPSWVVMTAEQYDEMFLREMGIKPEPLSEE
jgi:hypothetical protein